MLRTVVALAALLMCSITAVHAAGNVAIKARVVAVLADNSVELSGIGPAVLEQLVYPDVVRANQWLTEHVLQKEFSVIAGDVDRYGRVVCMSDMQQEMLAQGVAVFYASHGPVASGWKAAETSARNARRGVWGDTALALKQTPENVAPHGGKFVVVEGAVTRLYEAKNATYINFGENWREDFSVMILAKLRRSMKPMLQTMKPGDMLRVRGYVVEENGPMLLLIHADNLERI